MHVSLELKDVIAPDGKETIELQVNVLEEVDPADLNKDATPVMWATNVIVTLFQTGQIVDMVNNYKAQLTIAADVNTNLGA